MRYINELREGEMVSEVYLCKVKQTARTKAGKSYYSLILQDKTGTLDGKVWDLSSRGIEDFDAMDYIFVSGRVNCFQGSNQLSIERIRKAQEGEYIPSDYVKCTGKDIDRMYDDILQMISRTKDIYLKQLLESFFVKDMAFQEAFKRHSAAKTVHHGYLGGLLEHTRGVANLCEFYCTQYPILNRDLLVTAALFHDIGKMVELSPLPENDYTDEGQLIGHIVIGTMELQERIKTIPGFPVQLTRELLHCILAHHGELEFGSPKKPALIEALALTYADNTDAKIQTFLEELERDKEKSERGEWMGYNRFFESNLRATSKPNVK
ncbi:MAG: HD domain-containing protein [Firmicutes bacterium]|uniref:HD domain-containing protein n=1 Tax=Candidatus Scybalomonas excrementavium TaxID=2840943 RepID=A0A9D9HYV0_9FIRM|nr:HD domain-containing protein [Candidatus Scybalomonas excrementavium]